MARGYGDLAIKGLSRKSDVGNNMKFGLKVVGGVALFRRFGRRGLALGDI